MQRPIQVLTAEELKNEQRRVGIKFISIDARTYVLNDGRRFIFCPMRRKWIRCS